MNKERTWCVYIHINEINKKKYIGITSQNPKDRWGKNGNEYSDRYSFGKAIKKYGWDNFKHIVLYTSFSEDDAKWKEKLLIKLFNCKIPNGYNMTDGGDGVIGIEWTDERKEQHSKLMKEIMNNPNMKQKVSIAQTGKKLSKETIEKMSNRMRGVKRSDEFKQKMKTARLGYKHSEETKKKISETKRNRPLSDKQKEHLKLMSHNNIGRPCSKEARKKISQSLQGCILSQETKNKISETIAGTENLKERVPVVQLSKNGELIKIFDGVISASKETGCESTNIVKVCKNKRRTTGGFIWMYYKDYMEFTKGNIQEGQMF